MGRIGRRRFISLAGRATAVSLLAPEGAGAAVRARPNILFILADDLGYADLSCYGHRSITTPHLDGLAARGVRFAQAYANSSVCSATRAALITGRYQYRLRVGLEEPLREVPGIGLPPEHPTLPSLLRDAGYRTALVGKWHLGSLPQFGPLQSGYETFYGFRSGAVDYYSHKNPANQADLWDGDTPVEEQGYTTDLLGDRSIALLEQYSRGTAPFFMSLHFNAPHWPWEALGDDGESRRLAGKSLHHFDGGTMAVYKAMVERMDLQVGRILSTLTRLKLAKNTIVIFTSDNGGERFSDTWPFTGRKTELLEGGVRVPALLRWPGRVAPGRVSEQVIMSMDWMPTLLAAAGSAPDPAYPPDGMNLVANLTQGAADVPRKLFWRFKSNAQRSARDGNFKLLKIQQNTFLFNVVDDPQEKANLKQRHRDIYDRMTRDWDAWNATMLPQLRETAPAMQQASDHPDRYGLPEIPEAVDDISKWP
jgi:arylsulfatase A-like enzyme